MAADDKATLARAAATAELDALNALAGMARRGAATPAQLDAAVALLYEVIGELEDYRAGNHDPRRQRTMSRARQVCRALAAGATLDQVADRFGRSRSQINRYRRLVRTGA